MLSHGRGRIGEGSSHLLICQLTAVSELVDLSHPVPLDDLHLAARSARQGWDPELETHGRRGRAPAVGERRAVNQRDVHVACLRGQVVHGLEALPQGRVGLQRCQESRHQLTDRLRSDGKDVGACHAGALVVKRDRNVQQRSGHADGSARAMTQRPPASLRGG
eukprot:scaffold10064_cov130-Isochrysis_galbana.AAC.14